ncbi:hypothetical protein [Acinetobacter sp. YH12025]|uniref:hypothetical protein n=1 Tax=Acinetobacter sp. YH12025 TaxID=2601042 RepID=UPI0015D439AA|nr:hypothetical protein [Acinetobacter sp. YH12025]
MNIATLKTAEIFKKLPHLFKSKFIFFFLGFWLMLTAFHYVDIVPSDDYLVVFQKVC